MRVVVNEDMKVFHGHVPTELKKGQEVSGSLAELLLTSASRKVTRLGADLVPESVGDEEPLAEVEDAESEAEAADEVNIDGKIDDVLAWVGNDAERALEAHSAEEAKGDKARPRLLSKLVELIDEA